MRPVVHAFSVRCQSTRADIWKRFGETNLMNRFIQNAALDVRPLASSDSPSRHSMRTRLGGLPASYRDEPFEWVLHQRFSWRREFDGTTLLMLEGTYTFEDHPDGGCVVGVRLAGVARYWFARPILAFVQGRKAALHRRFIEAIDDAAMKGRELQLVERPADARRAGELASGLRDKHGPLVDQLVREIIEGGDTDVQRLRPFELARAWSASREAVLRMCLDATRLGLLDLRWALLCPSCRLPAETIFALSELSPEGHCPACDIRYGVELDRTVEATFAPHPTVRRMEFRPFCIGGPMLMPHVVSQAIARPGEVATLRAPEEPGRYRVFARGGAAATVEVLEGAPARVAFTLTGEGVAIAISPAQIDVAPGGEIAVEGAKEPLHAKLERVAWTFDAVTAMHVSALPEYRDQFGGNALRAGVALKVGRVAVLFSDLVGSTALYSKVGDAAAFGVVSDCLAFGRAIVDRHGGTVVKTMGDAIMAAFADPAAAVAAGAEMVTTWATFSKDTAGVSDVDLKVGVAAGPCTIVTANGVLDYFGQTVNTAARVQHLAGSRELVLTAELFDAASPPAGVAVREHFEARVKGIDAPLALVRLSPS